MLDVSFEVVQVIDGCAAHHQTSRHAGFIDEVPLRPACLLNSKDLLFLNSQTPHHAIICA